MVNPHFQTVVVVVTASVLMSCSAGPGGEADEGAVDSQQEATEQDEQSTEAGTNDSESAIILDTSAASDTLASAVPVYDSVYFESMLDRFEGLIADYAAISSGKEIWRMDSISPDSTYTRLVSLEEVLIQLNEVGSFLAGSGGQLSLNQILRLSDLQTLLAEEQQLAINH